MIKKGLDYKSKTCDDIIKILKNHLLLDKMEWLTDIIRLDGCPACKQDHIMYSYDMHTPFLKQLTDREINKHFIYQITANNIKK